MSEQTITTNSPAYLGFAGFAFGGAALILVIVHFVAGPFAPQQDMGVSLGELASDITKSAFRDFFGMQQPGAEPLPWDIDRVIKVGIAVAGGLAVLLGLGALLRHENKRVAGFAAALGVSALAIQVFATALAIIACVLILSAFLGALGDALPSFDWFGG